MCALMSVAFSYASGVRDAVQNSALRGVEKDTERVCLGGVFSRWIKQLSGCKGKESKGRERLCCLYRL